MTEKNMLQITKQESLATEKVGKKNVHYVAKNIPFVIHLASTVDFVQQSDLAVKLLYDDDKADDGTFNEVETLKIEPLEYSVRIRNTTAEVTIRMKILSSQQEGALFRLGFSTEYRGKTTQVASEAVKVVSKRLQVKRLLEKDSDKKVIAEKPLPEPKRTPASLVSDALDRLEKAQAQQTKLLQQILGLKRKNNQNNNNSEPAFSAEVEASDDEFAEDSDSEVIEAPKTGTKRAARGRSSASASINKISQALIALSNALSEVPTSKRTSFAASSLSSLSTAQLKMMEHLLEAVNSNTPSSSSQDEQEEKEEEEVKEEAVELKAEQSEDDEADYKGILTRRSSNKRQVKPTGDKQQQVSNHSCLSSDGKKTKKKKVELLVEPLMVEQEQVISKNASRGSVPSVGFDKASNATSVSKVSFDNSQTLKLSFVPASSSPFFEEEQQGVQEEKFQDPVSNFFFFDDNFSQEKSELLSSQTTSYNNSAVSSCHSTPYRPASSPDHKVNAPSLHFTSNPVAYNYPTTDPMGFSNFEINNNFSPECISPSSPSSFFENNQQEPTF